MESDPFTLKLTLKDPEALGIPMPEATWGELSYAETMRYAEEYGAPPLGSMPILRAAEAAASRSVKEQHGATWPAKNWRPKLEVV